MSTTAKMNEQRLWMAAGLVVAIGIGWTLYQNADAQRMAAMCNGPVRGRMINPTTEGARQMVDACHRWWGIEERKWPEPAKTTPPPQKSGSNRQPSPQDPFMAAMKVVDERMSAAFHKVALAQAPTSIPGMIGQEAVAAGTGIIRSIFDVQDTIFGESRFADKTEFRKKIDLQWAMVREQSPVYGVTEQIMRFAIAFIGLLILGRIASTSLVGMWRKGNKAG